MEENDFADALQKLQDGLVEECRKLHQGKPMEIALSPHLDANAIQKVQTAVEMIYEALFNEGLTITHMERDTHHFLNMSVSKKS